MKKRQFSSKRQAPEKARRGASTQAHRRGTRKRIFERVEAVVDDPKPLETPLLDAQRERFCQCLVTEPTMTAAARKAGYSPDTARQQGSRLLTNVDIQRRLAFLLGATAHRTILRRRDVMKNASARAAAAMTDFSDLLGLPWSKFCEAVKAHPAARAIKRIKRKVEYDRIGKCWSEPFVEEIELFDPRSSERLLADLLGWDAPKQLTLTPGTPGGENLPRGIMWLPRPEPVPLGDGQESGQETE
ncbi:MAG: terminase small subunit [Kiritimatiellae bacterium]|nr:terminase small subunit [Kiritimatiellia bacterium]